MIIEFYVAVKIAVRNPRGAVSRRFPSNYSMMIAQRPCGQEGISRVPRESNPHSHSGPGTDVTCDLPGGRRFLVFVDWFALDEQIPTWVFWETQVVFLIAIEIVYVVTLVGTRFSRRSFVAVFLRGRRRGTSGQSVARWLLCRFCLLLGLGMAEASAR